jgi:hypothetical protein
MRGGEFTFISENVIREKQNSIQEDEKECLDGIVAVNSTISARALGSISEQREE